MEFHHLAEKILFSTKQARSDTCTTILFLTTRLREPENDDWENLVHLMKYIIRTRNPPLTLSFNGSRILKLWIDGSFAVHPNMRGHTGVGLSTVRGFPIFSSTKQKLNKRSSTETVIVAVDDCIPAILWTRYWLDAQGYDIFENIIYQDNKNSIILENNSKAPRSKCIYHINIRYYFVTDCIERHEISP